MALDGLDRRSGYGLDLAHALACSMGGRIIQPGLGGPRVAARPRLPLVKVFTSVSTLCRDQGTDNPPASTSDGRLSTMVGGLVDTGLSSWWAPALAFAAGIVSFASPCVWPLVPGYVSFVTGSRATEGESRRPLMPILLFILGFTIVFTLLGAFAGTFVPLFRGPWFQRVAGLFVLLVGLLMLGYAFRMGSPALYAERRPLLERVRPGGAARSRSGSRSPPAGPPASGPCSRGSSRSPRAVVRSRVPPSWPCTPSASGSVPARGARGGPSRPSLGWVKRHYRASPASRVRSWPWWASC